jgi:hypothetical protein
MMKEVKCYHQSVAMATGCVLDGHRLIAGKCKVFSSPQHPDWLWGNNQPPIQWVPGAISTGVKWLWHEADYCTSFI